MVEVLFALINMNEKFVSKTLGFFFLGCRVSSWHLIMVFRCYLVYSVLSFS